MAVPKKLREITKYLKGGKIKLSASYKDGRINSSLNEDEVLKIIANRFAIDIPKSRSWYDFTFTENKIFYPVNIKVTDTTHNDNLNCKLGIYYCLTGKLPDFPNEVSWEKYFKSLKENLKKNKKDYYFLIVNKQNNQDIFINSLKGLSAIQPNGNNLPFQCSWGRNRKIKNKDFKAMVDFIMGTFGKSIGLRAEIYFNFKKYFSQYAD